MLKGGGGGGGGGGGCGVRGQPGSCLLFNIFIHTCFCLIWNLGVINIFQHAIF